jgi:hypothetical protein
MKKGFTCGLMLVLLVAAVALWYQSLEKNQKLFVNNLVRQIPDLPGRYSI